jgi:hypothetical protein
MTSFQQCSLNLSIDAISGILGRDAAAKACGRRAG